MTNLDLAHAFAESLLVDLHAAIGLKQFQPYLVDGIDGDHVKLFTWGSQHLRVYWDGRVEHSGSSLKWGVEIDHVLAHGPTRGMSKGAWV